MSVPIMDQACKVLDALDEGTMLGIIMTLKFRHPSIGSRKLKQRAKQILKWDDERFRYWADYYGL